jgi:hypothetical protein
MDHYQHQCTVWPECIFERDWLFALEQIRTWYDMVRCDPVSRTRLLQHLCSDDGQQCEAVPLVESRALAGRRGGDVPYLDAQQLAVSTINFSAQWREELVATCVEGILVFELTMGTYHVYFPTEPRWVTQVPSWATDRWQEFLTACEQWCASERMPISIVGDAHVTTRKQT